MGKWINADDDEQPSQKAFVGVWQPIETAPKDGRGVILCWSNWEPLASGVFVQVAAWWTGEGGEGDWIVYCDIPNEPRLYFNPTHWMPVPPPPCIT